MTRILLAVIAILVALLGYAMWAKSHAQAEAEESKTAQSAAESALAVEQRTRATEQAKAKQLASIATQYEQDKSDAQAKQDAVAAGLADGTVQLRKEIGALYTAQLSSAAAGAVELDAAAQRGADLAAAAIGAGARCDSQIRGLQAVVIEDRK